MIQGRQTLLTVLLFVSLATKAQKKEPVLLLREGRVRTTQNINDAAINSFNSKAVRHHDKAFAVLQFENLPTAETRNLLAKQGIELLEYIPENAYTVSITGRLNTSLLKSVGARTILQPTPQQKMHPAMAKGNIPGWAKKVKDKVDVWVSFPKTYKASEVVQYLKEEKIEVLSTTYQAYGVVEVRVPLDRLAALAALPFIEYVEPIPAEAQPLNMNSRNATRANVLNTSVADGGRGLTGEGVVIGVGDNGNVQSHADLSGSRLINKTEYAEMGIHAIHVTTTAAGAGNVNEYYKGYAPKATVVSQYMSGIIGDVERNTQDHGMVLTNNSYGTGGVGCGYYGEYSFLSRMMDQQAFDYPYLQHVFAAGNDGGVSCDTYPQGFHTVFGATQAAKNVVTVGGTEWNGAMWSGSSRGPVKDGRVKPEIAAQAAHVISGGANSTYGYFYGTSMASPAVTGGLALLYERYRQLHGGANPKNGLMKALLCNGGADLGNAGPDYSYGFGWMHLLRSVEILEKEQYKVGTLANGSEHNYTITVPSNTAQVKMMLYWNDPAASLMSSQALVNDLDLKVSDPSLAVHLPRILDPSAAGVWNTATTGADHLNNIEQVVIDHPAPGTYTVNIGGLVAQNPTQEYFVVYDILPVSTTLTNPTGGQGVAPGETIQINWDSYGDPANTFTLKYSTDNGATWMDMNTAVSASSRRYEWVVPNTPTNQALIRIERNGTSISHTSQPFTIIGIPAVSLSPVQCEGYMALTWPPVPGATGYEVMRKQDNEMVSVATTTATDYVLSGLSGDSLYWVGVRALVGDKPGRRGTAISRQPNSGTCAGAISDNDLKLATIVAPVNGRRYTATGLTGTNRVTIRVKNLDDAPVTGFTARYKLNTNDWVAEPVNATLPAGATYDHTFTSTEDLSAIGSYTLVAVVENHTPDPVRSNDTLATIVRHLDNGPIDLTTPFIDDLEGASEATYTKDTVGLAGIDRYDFTNFSSIGRLSTFGRDAFSGSKSLWLNSVGYATYPSGITSLTGTYNLSNYDVGTNDIRLSFNIRSSNGYNPSHKVWVRGSDAQSWIELLDFNSYLYNNSSILNIELADTLLKYGQNFSSGFQLKWDNDPGNYNSLLLDDINIYEALDDMQLLNIDPAFVENCGGAPLLIMVRNSSNKELTSVPVKYRINNGEWIAETIPSILPNTTIQYRFSTQPTFSAPGNFVITALVDYPTDNIHMNDTLSGYGNYADLVTAFPYLQNFESGKGGWYTTSPNTVWEYGTPVSPKINKAASGTKAWKTYRHGNFEDVESFMLYSPCLDVSSMANPTISFSIAEDLGVYKDTISDLVWVDYSIDNLTWNQLIDTAFAGTNWYVPERNYAWEDQKTRWHVVTMGLPRHVGVVRLRIGRYSHPEATTEGIAIDDIHIYDSVKAIYTGVSPGETITKPVLGNDWVDFESEGKLLASINAHGQNLGNTSVQAFIHPGPVRHNNQQYYHNRNITIKPGTTTLSDSVTVRMYFLDSETEALVAATGCDGCTRPGSAYELGVSKYSDPSADKENGTIADNEGLWSFIPSSRVTKVPFQKGYYAEFKVKDFSEFWLSNGGVDGLTPLPVKLLEFTAQKAADENVLLKWTTTAEINAARYEVELAKGAADLQAGRFVKIGEVTALGNQTTVQQYSYTDKEPAKSAVRYYRLRMIDGDGKFTYSPVRSVLFGTAVSGQLYPNPSTGIFNLVYQLNTTDNLVALVYDQNGRVVRQYRKQGTGAIQRLEIDLSPASFSSGIYMLQVMVNGRREFFKLHKL